MMKTELDAARLERAVLLGQLEAAQAQRDENKRLYETLLQVLNGQAKPVPAEATGQQRMLDLEQSIQVLRTFKQLYRSTAEFKCAGCFKSFKPVLFKAHHVTCAKLLESAADDRLFAKVVEVKGDQLRLVVGCHGKQWTVHQTAQEMRGLLLALQARFPTAQGVGGSLYQRVLAALEEPGDPLELMQSSAKLFAEVICPLYLVRKDSQLRDFLRLDEHQKQTPAAAPIVNS